MPDLVLLLAMAPQWVRAVVSVLLSLWAVATAVTNIARRIPRERFMAFERRYPRLGHLALALRKYGSDIDPMMRSLAAAMGRLPPAPPGSLPSPGSSADPPT